MHCSDIRRSLFPSNTGEASGRSASQGSRPRGPICPPRLCLRISPGHGPTAVHREPAAEPKWVQVARETMLGSGTKQQGDKHGDKLQSCKHAWPPVPEHRASVGLVSEMPVKKNEPCLWAEGVSLHGGTAPVWLQAACGAQLLPGQASSLLPVPRVLCGSGLQRVPRTAHAASTHTTGPTAAGAVTPSLGAYLFPTSSPFTTFRRVSPLPFPAPHTRWGPSLSPSLLTDNGSRSRAGGSQRQPERPRGAQ